MDTIPVTVLVVETHSNPLEHFDTNYKSINSSNLGKRADGSDIWVSIIEVTDPAVSISQLCWVLDAKLLLETQYLKQSN